MPDIGIAAGVCDVRDVMGMPVAIDIRDNVVPDGVVDAAFAWLAWVDATFSTYRADSTIAALNRGELRVEDVDPRVGAVLHACGELRQRTDGAFDAFAAGATPAARARPGGGGDRPGAIEPAGYVKGWAAAGAWDLLHAAGVRNALVDLGGDLIVRGRPAPGERWHVGIQHPLDLDSVAAVLELTDLAVATSGSYRRGDHIVDPATGAPPTGVLSVTCVGRDLPTVDALATAGLAMGRRAAAWLAVQRDVEAMVIFDDETVSLTPGFDALRVA